LPCYLKGNEDIFGQIIDKIEVAKQNAKMSLEAAKSSYTDNPTTRVHNLMEYLQNIKKIGVVYLM